MKLAIYKYPEDEQDFIGIIDIKERYTEMWYMKNIKDKTGDLQSFELGQISINDLKHMMEFLSDNI